MSLATQRDRGSFHKVMPSISGSTVDSEVNGAWIDRKGFLSADLALSIQPVLTEGETVSFAGNWQDADDAAGNGAADYGTPVTTVVIGTGTTLTDPAMTVGRGTGEMKADLTMARRYIRPQFTITTSSTGTASYAAAVILAGSDQNPV